MRRLTMAMASVALGAALVLGACGASPEEPGGSADPQFGLLSLGTAEVRGNADTTGASISSDGRVVAFSSAASNLVPGDTNGVTDTFVRDRSTGVVKRVAESTVSEPRVSGNGRYVSFIQMTAGAAKLGVHDRNTGATTLWTTTFNSQVPFISDDGTAAVYGAGNSMGLFPTACKVRDLSTNTETDCPHLGAGFGTVALEGVSRNARFVLYTWLDQNGGGTSGRRLWDRQTGTSVNPPNLGVFPTGPPAAFISDDGRFITGWLGTGGVPLRPEVMDVATGVVSVLPGPAPDSATIPVDISADGRVIALESAATNLDAADTNGQIDVFYWDTATGTVKLASKQIDTGAGVASGASACRRGSIIVGSGAGFCVLSVDPLSLTVPGSSRDAWLVPG